MMFALAHGHRNWKIFSSLRFRIILLLCCCTCGIFTMDPHQPQLLKTQDGYVIDNSLQSSEQDVRLEDFFWTGSGDGPPSYIRRPIKVSGMDGEHGRDTIVKTSTVLATVYIDGSLDEDTDDLCLTDCEDANAPKDYLPSDRRYWLLTVVSGFLTKNDFPILERKLAKLYRIAFSRQQSRHLGIANSSVSMANEIITNRKRSIATSTQISPTRVTMTESNDYGAENSTDADDYSVDIEYDENNPYDIDDHNSSQITTASMVDVASRIRRDVLEQTPLLPLNRNSRNNNNNNYNNNVVNRVSVLVHNITLVSEDENIHPDAQVESLIQKDPSQKSKTLKNQTEIIYSVFVNGKPVLATTAADDMKLLSEEEVAKVMEKIIYTKAEPYWKEPQATPLIPSSTAISMDGSKSAPNQIAMIAQNPYLIAILVAGVVLLICLLVVLMFMTRAQRIRSADIKRLTSGRALIGEDSISDKPKRGSERKTVGVDNLAYEQDGQNAPTESKLSKRNKKVGTPTLHFPRPPSTSPSTSNSDSMSSYYKTKHTAGDNQIHLFQKRTKHGVQDLEEYATIAKKRDRKQKKLRHKRKLQNRVGSIEETVQVHSAQSSCVGASDEAIETSGEPDSHFYEHIEAFNPHTINGNYHKNKLLTEQTFSGRGRDDAGFESPNEAYNREIMRAFQREGRPNDSLSIGSFLSMASVRSFPKCSVPEPLSRVLEPLSVTHLDQSDGADTARVPKIVNITRKQVDKVSQTIKGDIDYLERSQSGGAGIGPAVWQLHKKHMEALDSLSPLRDPVYTRNRFEGLLEGAIKLYSGEETVTHHTTTTTQFNEVPGAIRPRDGRGKSAMASRQKSLITPRTTSTILHRPVTAEPFSTNYENSPTEPPSPYKKAWASGAPSPLIRPLSAGPFHRPDPSSLGHTVENPANSTATAAQSTMLSTAPLIEAIQTELKKFDRYDSQ